MESKWCKILARVIQLRLKIHWFDFILFDLEHSSKNWAAVIAIESELRVLIQPHMETFINSIL